MAQTLWGKLFGDQGYISQALQDRLRAQGLAWITPRRTNMPPQSLPREAPLWLRKRSMIETIHDPLQHIAQIAHTRHRSVANFLVHRVCGLIAYCHPPQKPAIRLSDVPLRSLPQPV